jgi:hypothetical protein
MIVMSGMIGCGASDYAKAVSKYLLSIGFTVQRIDTDLYLGSYPGRCMSCQDCAARKTLIKVRGCTMSPMAVDTDKLNKTINDAAFELQETAHFKSGIGRIILILEGTAILGVHGYCAAALGRCWYFDTINTHRAKVRYLKESSKWRPTAGESDPNCVDRIEKDRNYQTWRWFEHQVSWASTYKEFASVVNLDGSPSERRPSQ